MAPAMHCWSWIAPFRVSSRHTVTRRWTLDYPSQRSFSNPSNLLRGFVWRSRIVPEAIVCSWAFRSAGSSCLAKASPSSMPSRTENQPMVHLPICRAVLRFFPSFVATSRPFRLEHPSKWLREALRHRKLSTVSWKAHCPSSFWLGIAIWEPRRQKPRPKRAKRERRSARHLTLATTSRSFGTTM